MKLKNPFALTLLPLEPQNRMVTLFRAGINENRPYIRFDAWWYGLRITLR